MGQFLTDVEELMLMLLIAKTQNLQTHPWLDAKFCPYSKEMRSQI